MKSYLIKMTVFLILVTSTALYAQSTSLSPQSMSISLGTSYYYIGSDFKLDGQLRNILLHYNFNLGNNFQLSIISGYGWASYTHHRVDGGWQFPDLDESDVSSKGFPVEIEFKYRHYLNADSVFEPTIGIGAGYCNYKSTLKNRIYSDSESELTTKGFSQYFSFGMNIHFSHSLSGFIEFKKLIITSIKTSGSLSPLGIPYPDTYEEDYAPSTGLQDLGMIVGVTFKL